MAPAPTWSRPSSRSADIGGYNGGVVVTGSPQAGKATLRVTRTRTRPEWTVGAEGASFWAMQRPVLAVAGPFRKSNDSRRGMTEAHGPAACHRKRIAMRDAYRGVPGPRCIPPTMQQVSARVTRVSSAHSARWSTVR